MVYARFVQDTVFWLPIGVATALAVLGGRRQWLAVFCGNALGDFLVGLPLGAALLAGVIKTAAVFVIAWLLSQLAGFDPSFRRARDYLHLALAGGIGTFLNATLGLGVGWLAGVVPGAGFFLAVLQRWEGDILSVLVVVPLVSIWRHWPVGWFRGWRALEVFACVGLNLVLGLVLFAGWHGQALSMARVEVISFIFVLWAGTRFGRHGTLLVILTDIVLCIIGHANGQGTFAHQAPTVLWLNMVLFTSIGLTITLMFHSYQSAQQALQVLEQHRLAIFLESPVPQAVSELSSGRFVEVNRAFLRLVGAERPEQVVGRTSQELGMISPEDRTRLLQATKAGLRVDFFPTALMKLGGERFAAEMHLSAYRDQGRELMLASIIDVTERKKAEDSLIASEARYRELIESAPIGVVLERDGRVSFANQAFVGMHRSANRDEVLGQPIDELVGPGWRALMDERAERRSPGSAGETSFEAVGRRRDGTGFPAIIAVSRLQLADGPATIAFVQDISTQKQAQAEREALQRQLLQAQKMEAVGELAGGVAHDFNNILAAMLLNLDLLLQEEKVPDGTRSSLEELHACAKRAGNLTRQLLLFSRRQALQPQLLDLDAVLGDLVKMLRRLIGEKIALEFGGAGGAKWLVGDAGMLEQLVVNLVVNARDAMPAGGLIRIITSTVELTEAGPHGGGPARHVRLEVTDTGCGMDEATRTRIFEPFFTTKERGFGTGLGLATVDGIVKEHRGRIEVASTVGQGTTFRIDLPAAAGPGPEPVREVGGQTLPRGSEAILMAEDDTAIRQMLAATLRRLGYTVAEAGSGDEAWGIWERRAQAFDLLVTDMVMPGELDGAGLAARLRRQRPALPVLIMSGYNPDERAHGIMVDGTTGYLRKPFDLAALAGEIRRLIDAR